MADHHKEDTIPVQIVEDLCQCALCLDTYEDPKTLPCRHSFCSDCLDNLVQFIANRKIMIKCPTCQESHNLSVQTVSKLKTELILVQMLHMLKTRNTRHLSKISIPCESIGCMNVATHWNRSQEKFECPECYKQTLFSFVSDPQEIKYSAKKESTEFICKEHESFQRTYCEDCQIPLCIYCQEWNHTKAHSVKKITDYQISLKDRLQQYFAKTEEMIDTLKMRQTETDTFISNSLPEIEKKIQTLAEDIKKFLNEFVDKCKAEYLANFQETMKYFRKENSDALNACEELSKTGEKLLQCPDNIEVFCKTPVVGRTIAGFRKSYLLNPSSLKAKLNDSFGDITKIEESIRECFGNILIERSKFCVYRITPAAQSGKLSDGEEPSYIEKQFVTLRSERMVENIYGYLIIPYKLDGFSWTVRVQKLKYKNRYAKAFLCVIIRCESISNLNNSYWTYKPIIQFRLKNTTGDDIVKEITETFRSDCQEKNFGIVSLKDLEDKNNGYLTNGDFVLEAVIRAQHDMANGESDSD